MVLATRHDNIRARLTFPDKDTGRITITYPFYDEQARVLLRDALGSILIPASTAVNITNKESGN